MIPMLTAEDDHILSFFIAFHSLLEFMTVFVTHSASHSSAFIIIKNDSTEFRFINLSSSFSHRASDNSGLEQTRKFFTSVVNDGDSKSLST
jgi:hypothetical protein